MSKKTRKKEKPPSRRPVADPNQPPSQREGKREEYTPTRKSRGCLKFLRRLVPILVALISAAAIITITPCALEKLLIILKLKPSVAIASPRDSSAVAQQVTVTVVIDVEPCILESSDKLYVVVHPISETGFNWYVVASLTPTQKRLTADIQLGRPNDQGNFEIWALITPRSLRDNYSPAEWAAQIWPTVTASHVVTVSRK